MPAADIILKNASVITMNPLHPAAGLVATKGNRILFVGSPDSQELVQGAETRIIDCQGKTVMPGFNDAHCHLFSLMGYLMSVDLSPASVSSIEDIKTALRRKAEKTPPGRWITGVGYNEFYLAEKRCPVRWDIDEVVPDHPVILIHRSLHACVLNSVALSLSGISSETSEPPGAIFSRDLETGEPNGILYEMVGYIREKVMPLMSQEELAEGIALVDRHNLSYGITSLQEGTVANNPARWQALKRFKENGRLKSRVSMMFGFPYLSEFRAAGLSYGSGDSQLRLGGVKIILSEATGRLRPEQAELNHQVQEAHRSGFQLGIHAIEREQVESAIVSLENLGSHAVTKRRHRIEHCSECPGQLLDRLHKIKPVIVTQPPFVYYSGERYMATVTRDRIPTLYRFRSLVHAGLTVAAGSDCPVVPANPFAGLYAAVTRHVQSGKEFLSKEKISAYEALTMYTVNAAYASFEEDIKGSITPGKLADMVVLSDNPLKVAPEELINIKAEMTIIDGKVAWEA